MEKLEGETLYSYDFASLTCGIKKKLLLCLGCKYNNKCINQFWLKCKCFGI